MPYNTREVERCMNVCTIGTSGARSSGVATPCSTATASRPTSAMSQASSGAVLMRSRPAPRKPRPMSIAGSAPSSADRPRSPANRESRTAVKNSAYFEGYECQYSGVRHWANEGSQRGYNGFTEGSQQG